MNYQKLQTASELYIKLNAVNEQIAGLEAVAIQVVDGSPEVSLNLSILSAKAFDVPEPEEVDDYYNGLPADVIQHFKEHGYSMMTSSGSGKKPKPSTQPITFYQSLSDVVTLQILHMIMYEKKQIKKEIVERIKELNLV